MITLPGGSGKPSQKTALPGYLRIFCCHPRIKPPLAAQGRRKRKESLTVARLKEGNPACRLGGLAQEAFAISLSDNSSSILCSSL